MSTATESRTSTSTCRRADPNTPRPYWPKPVGKAAIIVSLSEWPGAPRGDMESVRSISCRLHDAVERLRLGRASSG